MNAFELIQSRRSTRAFTDQKPADELVDQIVEAARLAPSGGNSQSTHLIVISNAGILTELAQLVETTFAHMEVTAGMYRSLVNSIKASKRGGYVFHYNAPVLIVACNKRNYGNAMADTACALQNAMLMANELNLGSCWINQLRWLADEPEIASYMTDLGMATTETVCGAVAIGYADTPDGLPIRMPLPRIGNPVTYVR